MACDQLMSVPRGAVEVDRVQSPNRQWLVRVERVDCGVTTSMAHWVYMTRKSEDSEARVVVIEIENIPEIVVQDGQIVISGVGCDQVFNQDSERVSVLGC